MLIHLAIAHQANWSLTGLSLLYSTFEAVAEVEIFY